MANPALIIELNWKEVPTTCEPCTACGDVIYGKQFQLFMKPGGAAKTKLCEACYILVKKDAVS